MARVNKQLGRLRIIAGEWRGRSIEFAEAHGVRPTHDRIRETLFNWLQGDIVDAKCLDLFAGSGALGFEALSRGADSVTMMESDRAVYKQLTAAKDLLKADKAMILQQPFRDTLGPVSGGPFDVVFLDPPYEQDLLLPAVTWLCNQQMVSDNALIYVEAEVGFDIDKLTAYFDIYRHKKGRNVQYALLRHNAET